MEYLHTPKLETDEYVLACYVNVNLSLVIMWYKSGFAVSVEEMVLKYKRLMYEPLLSL